jgi:hypothetical protein
VNSISFGGSPVMATVITATNHGFQNGQAILISGVTVADAVYYNGTFIISGVTANTFKYPLWGTPSGGVSGGSIIAQPDPCRFDMLMRSLQAGPSVAVRLGPGTIQTKGHNASCFASWSPGSGMRIRGSGMEVTTLKIFGAIIDDCPNSYYAISCDSYLEGFDASDFTIDCNIAGQLSAKTSCGGIDTLGKHTRFRRLRAVNFGTQVVHDNNHFVECFVLLTGGARPDVGFDVVDCVIEDCIVEQPGQNNIVTTTLIGFTSSEANGLPAYHRACVIRNCFLDIEFRQNPVPVSQITVNNTGGATVTTRLPHGLQTYDWARISGVVVNGSTDNSFNGCYKVSYNNDYSFDYGTNPVQPPGTITSGDMWVGRFPSYFTQITNITAPVNGIVTVTTLGPHFLAPNQTVVISQVVPTDYNGTFKVQNVTSWNQFTIQLAGSPSAPTSYLAPFIGVLFQGPGIHGGTAAVDEGNRVINCEISGPYADTWAARDGIIRNNYHRGTSRGPFDALGGKTGAGRGIPLASLTHSGTTAFAATTRAHGFVNHDKVLVFGASGADGQYYNNPPSQPWDITVTDANHFQYTMSGTPGADAQGASYGTQDAQFLLVSLSYTSQSGVYVATGTVVLQGDPQFNNYPQTPYGHGLSVGDIVLISNVTGQIHNDYFNGYRTVTDVPDQRTFRFNLPGDPNPTSSSGSSPSGYFGRLWNAGRMVVENNLLDLVPVRTNAYRPAGISLGSLGPQVVLYPQVLLRRNVIRHVDAASDSLVSPLQYLSIAIEADLCGALLAEENIVDLEAQYPIVSALSNVAKFFANQTSAGALIQGYTSATSPKVDELSTAVEDAVLLAF